SPTVEALRLRSWRMRARVPPTKVTSRSTVPRRCGCGESSLPEVTPKDCWLPSLCPLTILLHCVSYKSLGHRVPGGTMVELETNTREGPVSYRNAYVAVLEMHGRGDRTTPLRGLQAH